MSDRVEPGEALELRRGRPRDASIDQAILDAAQELVGQVGYARMSIDLVARRAGVTRPTVYLRWRNKPELVHAALFRRSNRWPDTGDLRGDLIVIARRSAKAWAVPGVRAALLGLLADAAVDDELHAAVMASILGPTKAWLVRLFASAAARGEVCGTIDVDEVHDLYMGPLFQHYVCNGGADPTFGDVVVDALLRSVMSG